MGVYRINLYKRNSRGRCFSTPDNYFVTLGHFDYMNVENVEASQLKDIFSYNTSVIMNGYRYFRYSIFAYDRCEKPFFDDITEEKNIFLISCAKLNMDVKRYESAVQMFEAVEEIILDELREYLSSIGCNPKDCDIRVSASLGSFDVIIAVGSNKIETLLKILPIIHDIKHGDGTQMFSYTNTFYAVHDSFDLGIVDDNISILISFCLKNLDYTAPLEEFFRNSLHCTPILYPTYGEYDISLVSETCSFQRLLFLLGVRKNGSGFFEEETLSTFEKYVIDNVKSIFTRIQCKPFSKFGSCPPPGNTTVKTSANERHKRLEYLKKDVEEYIPISAKRTLELLIDKCVYLIDTEHRLTTGTRVYHILCDALEAIKDNLMQTDEILRCLGNISSTIEVAMQTDNVQLDYIDGDDVMSVAPTIKCMYAYENMFRNIQQLLNYSNTTSQFFLTFYPTEVFNSEFYFNESGNDYRKLVSVNLPSAHYFNPELSVPYIIHEMSHYVAVTGMGGVTRNKALFGLFINYMKVFLWTELKDSCVVEIRRKDFDRLFTYFIDEAKKLYPLNFTIRARNFPIELRRFLAAFYDAASDHVAILNREGKQGDIPTSFHYFLSALRILKDRDDHIELLSQVAREARADVIMCEVCNLDIVKYVEYHYNFVEDNLRCEVKNFQSYKLRLVAVILLLSQYEDLDVAKGRLSPEAREFAEPVFELIGTQSALLKELVEYLQMVSGSVHDKATSEYFSFFRMPKYDIDETVCVLLNEWYDNIKYWRGK